MNKIAPLCYYIYVTGLRGVRVSFFPNDQNKILRKVRVERMKKRFTKLLALLLSATMVFTMNSFAFAEPAGQSSGENEAEEIQTGVEEGKEVSIEQMTYDATNHPDYVAAFNTGYNHALLDRALENKTNYLPDNDKDTYDNYTEEEKAGYQDGYSAYGHTDYFSALRVGFNFGVFDGVYGGKYDERVAANDDSDGDNVHPTVYLFVADKDNVKGYYEGETYKKGYQSGYGSGFETGVSLRNAYAKSRAENYFNGNAWFNGNPIFAGYQFINAKPYSAYETDVAKSYYIAINDEDFGDEYKKAWHAAYDEFYKNRKTYGEKAGKNDAKLDGRNADPAFDKVISEITDEADAQTIQDNVAAGIGWSPDYKFNNFVTRWKIINSKFEANDDGYNMQPVNEDFIAGYISGYNSVFPAERKATQDGIETDQKNMAERAAYIDGFNLGFANGQTDGRNGNTDADDAAKKAEAPEGAWHQYVNDTDNHTAEEIMAYKNGYKAGYDYAFKDMTEEEGYMLGYDSGYGDGTHDRYGNDRNTANGNVDGGYYEPDYADSAYNAFKASGSTFGKGYMQGYMDGYNTGLSEGARNERLAKGEYDYSSADLNNWRISADPETWDTSQLLIWEKTIPADPDAPDVGQNLFFDTRTLTDNWVGDVLDLRGSIQFKDKLAALAGGAQAEVIATSPFQYYFDLYAHDHLVDKVTVSPGSLPVIKDVYVNGKGINNGSIGQYLYRAIPASSNKAKPKKLPDGTEDTGKTYVIVRYRLADAETDENYKVRRYSYDTNGKETVNEDIISDYYQGESGSEPVVQYDSRKIGGMKPENPKGKYNNNNHIYNDKGTRNAIDVEALVISWTEGSPAKLIGKLDLNVTAKNNLAATVPHTYITFNGDTEIDKGNTMPSEYNGGMLVPNYIQTDKGALIGRNIFSRYYKATEENPTGEKVKANRGVITYAAPQSAAKLTNAENAYVSKKGESPSFTLKMKTNDPVLKAYSKDVKKALKSTVFNFEISRMKIASDFDTHMQINPVTGAPGANPQGEHYIKELKLEDTKVMNALLSRFVPAPKRSDYNSLADYQNAVKEYLAARRKFGWDWDANGYTHSDEFKDLAIAGFKEYIAAYKKQYDNLKSQYGSNLDYFKAWIADEQNGWASNHGNDIAGVTGGGNATGSFPYIVTETDRTTGGRVIPVGDTVKYRTKIPEDANCDGQITAEEHYIYRSYVGTNAGNVDFIYERYKDQFDPAYKTSSIQPGDNILNVSEELLTGDLDNIDYDDLREHGIAVNLNPERTEVTSVVFTFTGEKKDGTPFGPYNVSIEIYRENNIEDVEYGKYYYHAGNAGAGGFATFLIYIDFLEDAPTDIELIQNYDLLEDTVLYPGGQEIDVYSGFGTDWNPTGVGGIGPDIITIDFTDPKVKKSKAAMSMTVTPLLISRIHTSDPANPAIIQKKLKTTILKEGAEAKPGKGDIQIQQKMANTEPFVVATGVNNFEGSIAMRQRQNGDIGYGYFKNDDYYYIFGEEE